MRTTDFRRRSRNWAAMVVAAGLLFGSVACSTDADSSADDDKRPSRTSEADGAKETKKEEPAYDGKAFAKQVTKEMQANLGGGKINSRCDYSDMRWHCFFDRYESPLEGRVDVHLSFPGDVSGSEADDFAEEARLHTFNLAGYSIEELDTIVSFNNGVDSGTTRRGDVPLLN